MKHYIISKFRPGTPWREYLPEIEATYFPPAPSGRTGLIL